MLSTLGTIDPSYAHLITFDLDRAKPRLSSSVAFQVPVTIKNLIIHRCIIDKGESTCVMSTHIFKMIGSVNRTLSLMTLWAYDGHPPQPQGLLTNVPI